MEVVRRPLLRKGEAVFFICRSGSCSLRRNRLRPVCIRKTAARFQTLPSVFPTLRRPACRAAHTPIRCAGGRRFSSASYTVFASEMEYLTAVFRPAPDADAAAAMPVYAVDAAVGRGRSGKTRIAVRYGTPTDNLKDRNRGAARDVPSPARFCPLPVPHAAQLSFPSAARFPAPLAAGLCFFAPSDAAPFSLNPFSPLFPSLLCSERCPNCEKKSQEEALTNPSVCGILYLCYTS